MFPQLSTDRDNGDEVKTSFPAIIQCGRGEPADVLHLTRMPSRDLHIGARDVLLYVCKRPVHRVDIALLRSQSQDDAALVSAGRVPTPGLEGVGVIVQLGAAVRLERRFSVGQRVAFLAPSWSARTVAPCDAVFAIPDEIPDTIAAQLLVNALRAQMAMKNVRLTLASAPYNITLPEISIASWWRTVDADERAAQVRMAIDLATRKPELFGVAREYEFVDFLGAIAHAGLPGTRGTVLLNTGF